MPEIISPQADMDALKAVGWDRLPSEIDAAELLAEILDGIARWIRGSRDLANNKMTDDPDDRYWRGILICADQVREVIDREIAMVLPDA